MLKPSRNKLDLSSPRNEWCGQTVPNWGTDHTRRKRALSDLCSCLAMLRIEGTFLVRCESWIGLIGVNCALHFITIQFYATHMQECCHRAYRPYMQNVKLSKQLKWNWNKTVSNLFEKRFFQFPFNCADGLTIPWAESHENNRIEHWLTLVIHSFIVCCSLFRLYANFYIQRV